MARAEVRRPLGLGLNKAFLGEIRHLLVGVLLVETDQVGQVANCRMLQVMHQPIEDGGVSIARARETLSFPATFHARRLQPVAIRLRRATKRQAACEEESSAVSRTGV